MKGTARLTAAALLCAAMFFELPSILPAHGDDDMGCCMCDCGKEHPNKKCDSFCVTPQTKDGQVRDFTDQEKAKCKKLCKEKK